MSEYKYVRPLGVLYKMSVRQWNKSFAYRGRGTIAECYVTDEKITVFFMPALWARALLLMLYPIIIIIEGVANAKNTHCELARNINARKYGAFSSDVVWNSSDGYAELCEVLRVNHE
jgi:hypothetical protein